MTWTKFKKFLKKNLGDNWAFANNIYPKFRKNSRYQAKSGLDWAAHLEDLQYILLEYDQVRALSKSTMLKYFQKGPKPSILAELEHQNLELKNFNQIVKITVDAKAKSALQPRFNTKKMDQHYPWGN